MTQEIPVLEHSPAPAQTPSQRLMSIDALRGFDMFWIVGADALIQTLARIFLQSPVTKPVDGSFPVYLSWGLRRALQILADQMEHVAWDGFHFYDLIFPLFVFIVGASLVFSLSRTIERDGRGAAIKRIVIRSLCLYVIGILYYGNLASAYYGNLPNSDRLRVVGVLQRIAISYLFAGLLFCFLKPRWLVAICIALLAGYWAIMTFVPVPGAGEHSFEEGKNLANYLDKYLYGRKWDVDHDPEGLLSSLPAIATCLLGVFAGLLLRNDSVKPYHKVAWLFLAGALAVSLGYLWGHQIAPHDTVAALNARPWFPVIKKVWTSSFVLVAGGYSAMLYGAFYLVIDIWKLRRWAQPFVWIGMNAITLYLLDHILDFSKFSRGLIGGDERSMAMYWNLLSAAISFGVILLIARFLYKRSIFIRL